MKNILNKIYIHPLTFIVVFISLFTGLFKELLIFISIIIIHELGHLTAAYLFKWKIEKIKILPFGGIIIFNELLNKPLIEELIILVTGPIFQVIYYILFKDINDNFNYYNYGLFLFNFFPIYPLDGYKLWSIIFEYFIPYKIVLRITNIISFVFILLIFRLNLIYILVLLFLFIGLIKQYRNIDFIYNKFLLERYTYCLRFKRRKIIGNINNMYRDCIHLFKEDKLITEKEVLSKYFSSKYVK